MLNLDYMGGGDPIMQNRLRHFREEKGWTQDELAAKSGVSRVTISGIESGRVTVAKTDTLVHIADALEKPVSDVFFCEK